MLSREELKNLEEILRYSNDNKLPEYEITDNGINVTGHVFLGGSELFKMSGKYRGAEKCPFKFNIVSRIFDIGFCHFKTLENLPRVCRTLDIAGNDITNLKGITDDIAGTLRITFCDALTSLEYVPNSAQQVIIHKCDNLEYAQLFNLLRIKDLKRIEFNDQIISVEELQKRYLVHKELQSDTLGNLDI